MSGARRADHLDVCAWREAQFLARCVGWLREIADSKVVQKTVETFVQKGLSRGRLSAIQQ
jgi:hypothetical protein